MTYMSHDHAVHCHQSTARGTAAALRHSPLAARWWIERQYGRYYAAATTNIRARARDIHTGDAQPHRDARSMKPTVELQRPETPLHVRYMPLSTHLTWASRGPITLCHTSHNHLYSLRAGGGGSATSTVYRLASLPRPMPPMFIAAARALPIPVELCQCARNLAPTHTFGSRR
jgi:hypothetical protein